MMQTISAKQAASSSKGLSALSLNNGNVYVVESRPAEKGRRVLLKNGEEVLGCHTSVNSNVHEYGGGEYLVDNEIIYFANYDNQRWYQQKPNQLPMPITPAPVNKGSLRFADPCITPDGQYLICVQEEHVNLHDVRNSLVAIKTDGSQVVIPLVGGDDFYASPCVSPDGKKLAWVSWNHPQMPWDGCELSVARTAPWGRPGLTDIKKIAGGPNELIYQPSWYSNDELCFVSDASGYANLYLYNEQTQSRRNLFPIQSDCFYPQWVFGTSCYCVIPRPTASRVVRATIAVIVTDQGEQSLWLIDNDKQQKIELPYTSFAPYIKSDGEFIYCIASSATQLPTLIKIDCETLSLRVSEAIPSLRESASDRSKPYSTPKKIVFPTENNRNAYGFYYPAIRTASASDRQSASVNLASASDRLPPLIVISHGGPSGATDTSLNMKIQFWTSHGFAVMDVNYGGSTGYGRAYRERLKNNWGIVDVQDCVNAARYCVKNNMADPGKLIIRGSSAGGFTVLAALTFYDDFKCGASYYGVADLMGLLNDTHKFEARYLDTLIGEYPTCKKRYEERSPLLHAEKLSCPVIFFQGLKDKVVPPEQAEKMIAAMQKNNIPCEYITFAGEGHGFRNGDNVAAALKAELAFYQKHLNLF